jgi:predicted regulator of Ras-like GTPase activity (Roadblock/LC7/MglB family)
MRLLQSKLQSLCSDVDGAAFSFCCGFDGIIIDKHAKGNVEIDVEFLAANFASVIKNISFDKKQKLIELIVTLESYVICIKILPDAFIGLGMAKDGNIGRAKFELNKIGGDILSA